MEKSINIKTMAEGNSNAIIAIAKLVGLARTLGAEDQAKAILLECGIVLETEVI